MACSPVTHRNDGRRKETMPVHPVPSLNKEGGRAAAEAHAHPLPVVISPTPRLLVFPSSRMLPFRVTGPHERGRFAAEAWGHLLALRDSGALGTTEFEHLIDRALSQFDGRIALDDVRALLDGAGLDESPDGSAERVH